MSVFYAVFEQKYGMSKNGWTFCSPKFPGGKEYDLNISKISPHVFQKSSTTNKQTPSFSNISQRRFWPFFDEKNGRPFQSSRPLEREGLWPQIQEGDSGDSVGLPWEAAGTHNLHFAGICVAN